MTRLLHKSSWLLLASLLAVLASTNVASAKRKLHVLIIGDTEDAKIGKAASADVGAMSLMFGGNVKREELHVEMFTRGPYTENAILRKVRNLGATREDAICVYYSGHGAYGRGGSGHFLVTDGSRNWTSRARLEQSIQRQGVGLGVLITDACFNFVDIDTDAHKAGAPVSDRTSPLFKRLFFQTNGFISINSCQRDQLAGCYPDQTNGSIFTNALAEAAGQYRDIDGLGWSEIFDKVSSNTAKRFKEVFPSGETVEVAGGDFKNQLTQTPAKLAFNIRNYNPSSGSGALPEPPGPQVSEFEETRINPDTGKVYVRTVTRTFNPNTGRTSVSRGPERPGFRDATLLYALNGQAFWIYPPDAMVRANRPNGTPTRPGPGPGLLDNGRRYLGVTAQNALGRGVLITKVNANSPATKVKDRNGKNWFLEPGDRIISIGGRATNNEQQYVAAVQNGPPRAEITIISKSDRRQYTFAVDLTNGGGGGIGSPPPPRPNPNRGLRFGATVVERRQAGVRITVVERGSPATKCFDAAGNTIFLEPNDIITRINGQPTNTEAQYVRAVSSSPQRMRIELLNSRDGSRVNLTVMLRY